MSPPFRRAAYGAPAVGRGLRSTDQTQKAGRLERLQRSPIRSAYFLTGPHLAVVAVHLVCRINPLLLSFKLAPLAIAYRYAVCPGCADPFRANLPAERQARA